MGSIRYVFSLLVLLFVSACTEAIPTVTELSTPITQTAPATGTISAGGGVSQSTNFRINGMISPTGGEMVGTNFRIKTSGVE
jgi:hypothetical protein